MTHWKKLCNPDYLGAYFLDPGQELDLTLQKVQNEVVTGADGKKESCIVAHFQEAGIKPMILNRTNCKAISKALGSSQIEDWIGKQIRIYAEQVRAFGEMVEALRVRPKAPAVNKPQLTPEHEKWAGAVKATAESGGLAMVKQYYRLTAEHEALLLKQAKEAAEHAL